MEFNGIATFSFSDFPEDVQLCILSFLNQLELATFASTSKRFLSLFRNDPRLWFSMCDRRWGSNTLINKWGNGKICYKHLYKTLHKYGNLIGLWRRCGSTVGSLRSPLIFFEWGPFYIMGSGVSPSKTGTRHVVIEESVNLCGHNSSPIKGLTKVPSSGNAGGEECEDVSGSPGSLPDRLMSEIYQHFANKTSPGGNGSSRRLRRREKEKQERRKLEPEFFVKTPTTARPLQGLWKGISDDMSLEFYLINYDEIGGLACRRVGDLFSDFNRVFWASNISFIEPPFSAQEEYEYESRMHLRPPAEAGDCHEQHLQCSDHGAVSRMLHMTSSYDLVIPGTPMNPRQVEGRIWQYKNGTFGFGFLRNNYIIDLKHIAQGGHILDTMEFSSH